MVLTAKNPPANAGDTGDVGSIPGPGKCLGNGNPPQYSGLENPMDKGAWWAGVHGVAKDTTKPAGTVCKETGGSWPSRDGSSSRKGSSKALFF